jgi:hypothetical protein
MNDIRIEIEEIAKNIEVTGKIKIRYFTLWE